jgi:hypothetical protein
MKRFPLSLYATGVMIVLVLINCIAWFVGGVARLKNVEIFSSGFLLGMLAMYTAVHIYWWK